jgi:hypothetical protein
MVQLVPGYILDWPFISQSFVSTSRIHSPISNFPDQVQTSVHFSLSDLQGHFF